MFFPRKKKAKFTHSFSHAYTRPLIMLCGYYGIHNDDKLTKKNWCRRKLQNRNGRDGGMARQEKKRKNHNLAYELLAK